MSLTAGQTVPTVVATISTNDVDYRQWTALTLRVLVSVFPRCWDVVVSYKHSKCILIGPLRNESMQEHSYKF